MATNDLNTSIRSAQILKHTIELDDISPDALVFQEPVIDKDLTSPPGGESEGDRYIVASTAFSWDLLDEDCAGIADWVDGDSGNAESTQVTYDTKSCFKFDTKTAPGNAWRQRDITIPDNYTIELNVYCDAISNLNDNALELIVYNGVTYFDVFFRTGGLFIYDGSTYNEVGTDLVVQDAWQKWRFVVTGGNADTATCDVYLNDVLKASDVDCSNAGALERCTIILHGLNDNNRIAYVDYIKIGTGLAYSDDWIGQENKVTQNVSSAWSFYTPLEGWITWVKDENKFYYNNGSSWNEIDLSKLHTKQHSITDTAHHTSNLSENYLMDADVNGLPDNSGLSVVDAADAITKKHIVNEDTALGAQSEDLDMNTHKITEVVNPVSDQDAETKKHVADTYSPIASPTFTTKITTPIIDLTGGQIAFPATAVPSADPNTLDDYEEGTYEVTLTCGTSGTITLQPTINTGAYTKKGREVSIQGYVQVSAFSSPVGDARISIPFSAANLTEQSGNSVGSILVDKVNWSGDQVVILVQAGQSFFIIKELNKNANSTNINGDDFEVNDNVFFGVTYIAG